MAQQTINVGATPNDGTGDTLRDAFIKTDENFDELYTNRISGSGTDNYVPRFNGTNALENSQIFDNGSGVGIGTTNPLGILHLYKSSATTRMLLDGDAGQSKIITYRTGGLQRFGMYVNNTAESGSNAGSDFQIRSYNDAGSLLSTPLFIKRSTGNIGIGTTNPTVRLQVDRDGTGVVAGFSNQNDADLNINLTSGVSLITPNTGILAFGTNATEKMRITSAGNVGIGTTTPSKRMEIRDTNNVELRVVRTGSAGLDLGAFANQEARISTSGAASYLTFFTNNGVGERMRITANGTVGIGTNTPQTTLTVNEVLHTTVGEKQYFSLTTDNSLNLVGGVAGNGTQITASFIRSAGSKAFYIGTTGKNEALYVTNSGNIGIGTNLPQNRFHAYGGDIVVGNDLFYAGRFSNNSNKAVVIGYDSANNKGHIGSISPGVAWTDLILNANGGNVGIGDKLLIKTTTEFTSNCTTHIATGTNGGIVIRDVAGNGILQLFQHAPGTNVGSITQNGVTTSYNITSDYRLKQDFKNFNGLDLVSKIKVYDYEWKSDKSRMNGVIAHELQEVIPYAVSGKKDGENMQQVDYSKLVPILVQAIQDQQTQIEELKTLINK